MSTGDSFQGSQRHQNLQLLESHIGQGLGTAIIFIQYQALQRWCLPAAYSIGLLHFLRRPLSHDWKPLLVCTCDFQLHPRDVLKLEKASGVGCFQNTSLRCCEWKPEVASRCILKTWGRHVSMLELYG